MMPAILKNILEFLLFQKSFEEIGCVDVEKVGIGKHLSPSAFFNSNKFLLFIWKKRYFLAKK